jgi:phospholipid/cholesterol/gamma-HCH transport system substrate-binding protein
METNVKYTIAGAFVLMLVTFIVLAIIWLSAGFTHEEYSYYNVYMRESVSGLSINGPVEFNGVEVGTVDAMKIEPQNPELVELLLKIKSKTPVTEGTTAKLGLRALTGVAYILLEDKGKDIRPLVAKAGEKFPIIPTVPSILVRLDSTLTQINNSIREVTGSIKLLLNEQNLQSIQLILQSGKKSMRSLEKETIPHTTQTIRNINTLTNDLNDLTREIKLNPSMIIRGKAAGTAGPGE